AVVLAIVVFQFVTEVIIGFNYALGQITVTPMALLMTHLASPVAHADMPVERVLDTMVGAALGIALALVFSSLDERRQLARWRRRRARRRWAAPACVLGRRRARYACHSPTMPRRKASTQMMKIRPMTMVTDSPRRRNQLLPVSSAMKRPKSPTLFSSSTTMNAPSIGPTSVPMPP